MRCMNCMTEYDEKYGMCPVCGTESNATQKEPYFLKPGTVIRDRYEIGAAVGSGGFGITYKAWDKTLCMIVAIKEYYPRDLAERAEDDVKVTVYTGTRDNAYKKGRDYFLKEARNMAKFNKTDNIVKIQDFFEDNDTAYIVMEYLDGISFKEYLKSHENEVSIDFVREVATSVLSALDVVHKEGVLHRDISPDNIYICNDGKIKLIDFGAARAVSTEAQLTKSLILKPGYSPPEQYKSKDGQGPWTDIYAVGATLYRALTGITPEESIVRIENDLLKSPKEINKNVPGALSSCVMKALELNPEKRYKSAEDFLKAISSGRKERNTKKKKRKIIVIPTVILSVIAVLALSLWIGLKIAIQKIDDQIPGAGNMIKTYLSSGESISSIIGTTIEMISSTKGEGGKSIEELLGDNLFAYVSNISIPDSVLVNAPDMNHFYFMSEEKAEIEVGCPIEVADGMELWLDENISIRIIEGGEIVLKKGGTVHCDNLDKQIIEDGGKFIIEE